MKRKMLALVLALAMAVFAPLSAMAATQYTLSLVPGDDLASEQVVADLLNALALRLTIGENAAALGLDVSGTPVFDAALRVDEAGAGIFVESQNLSENVMFFTADDIVDAMVSAMETQGIEADDLAEMRSQLKLQMDQMMQLPAMLATADPAATTPASTDPADIEATLNEAYPNDPNLVKFIMQIVEKMEITEGEFTSEMHDPATTSVKLDVTDLDYELLLDTELMKTTLQPAAQYDDDGNELSADAQAARLAELTAEVREVYANTDMHFLMEAFATENTLVSMVYTATMNATDDDDRVSMNMDMNYDRLTTDAGVNHNGTLKMQMLNEDDDTTGQGEMVTLDGALNALTTADGATNGTLALLTDGTQLTASFVKSVVDTTDRYELSFYVRNGATAIVELAAADRPVFGIVLEKAEVSDDAFAAITAATVDAAVQPVRLSTEEAATFNTDMMTRLQQTLYSALSVLPQSVLENIGALIGQ